MFLPTKASLCYHLFWMRTDAKKPFLCSMALQIASLNSGSNGNCYYVGNHTDAILVDAGISCRETEKRMKLAGLDIKKLKAIFVSHEHTDHIKGVSTLANKYKLPVYITEKTARRGPILIRHLSQGFGAGQPVEVGSLKVLPFTKKHDADDPHSFLVSFAGITVGVLTDIGTACSEVVHHFKQCHAVFLESNYDEDMLENGKYPLHLKNRIRGNQGHLSNKQALELFLQHRPPFMSHVILSHLSKENNSPEIALQQFAPHAGGIKILVAGRYAATEVFEVSGGIESNTVPAKIKAVQISLFA